MPSFSNLSVSQSQEPSTEGKLSFGFLKDNSLFENKDFKQGIALQAAVTNAANNYSVDDPEFMKFMVDELPKYNLMNSQEIMDRALAFNTEAEKQGIRDYLASALESNNREEAISVANAAPQAMVEITKEEKQPGKFEQNLVETTTTLNDEASKNVQFIAETANRLHKIIDDQNVWDWITNVGGSILLPGSAVTWQQITEGNPLHLEDNIVKYIRNFREMPVDEKRRMWPVIEKAVLESSGHIGKNELEAVQILYSLIDPLGEYKAVDQAEEDAIFLGLNVTAIGAPFIKAIANINRFRKLTAVAELNPDLAAKVNIEAIKNKNLADSIGVKQVDAVTRAQLFDESKIDPQFKKTFAYANDKELRNLQKKLDIQLQNVPRLEHGILFRDEIQAATDKQLEKGLDATYFDSPRLISVDREKPSSSGFDVAYKLGTQEGGFFKSSSGARKWAQRNGIENPTVKKAEEGYYVELRQRFNFNTRDVQDFQGAKSGFWSRHIYSPTSYLANVDKRIVPSATRVEFADAALFASFRNTARGLLKDTIGIRNLKSRARVDNVLLEGDSTGVTFSPNYLKRTYDLNDKEIKAYYGFRRIFDNLWFLRNDVIRKELDIKGYKYSANNPGGPFVRPYKEANNAFNALPDSGVIYDLTRNGEIRIGSLEDAKKIYDRGDVIVKYPEMAKLGQNGYYQFAVVPKYASSDLPFAVTNFREGYVPKFNRDAYYFVKQYDNARVNGINGRVPIKTLRIAPSKTEALQIVEQEKLLRSYLQRYMESGDTEAKTWLDNNGYDVKALVNDINENKFSFSQDIEYSFDREMSDIALAYDGAGPTRGMYLGHRAQDLRYGLDMNVPERFSAFRSLQRNMDNLSSLMARNEWRIGMEQRILNTWKQYLENPRISRLKDARIKSKYEGTQIEQGFIAAKEYLLDQIRIPTGRELLFQHAVRNLAEWAEGPTSRLTKGTKARKVADWARFSLLNLSHRDPYAMARAAAFHPLLGAFNFAQLYVQAQGATVAMSVNPIYGAQAAKDYPLLRWFMHDSASEDQIKTILANIPGVDTDYILKLRRLFISSGFRESAFKTADFETAVDGYSLSAQTINTVMEKGLMFYREGELFNKGVSLDVALRRWQAKNPGKEIDAFAEQEIVDDAIKLTLNMTRANRAWWQKGITSVPTQFLQVHAKYLEAVFRKEGFTPEEANRLIIGQIALYGSTGVPFGAQMYNGIMKILGTDPQHIEPDFLKEAGVSPEVFNKYVRGGVPDALAMALFGADVELGGRSSIADGVTQLLTSFLRDDFQMTDLAGAFGGTTSRFWNGFKDFGNLVIRPAFDPDMKFTKTNIAIFLNDLARTASSWNNAQKAWFWYHSGKLESRYGRILTDEYPNFSTAVALALGFQPTEIKAIYEGKQMLQYHDKGLQEIANKVVEMHLKFLKFAPDDPVEREKQAQNLAALQEMYMADLDPGDRQIIKNKVYQVYTNSDSELSKVQKQYADKISSQLMEDFNALNPGPWLNPLLKEEAVGKK